MTRDSRWRIAWLLVAVAVALPACSGRRLPPPLPMPVAFEPRPLLWRAVAPGGDIAYLLGSVHLTRRAIEDLGPVVEDAWRASDALVVEVDITRLSSAEMASLTARYGTLARGSSVHDVISHGTSTELSRYLASREIDAERVAAWKPWFVYFVIVQHELARAGYRLEQGVDRLFLSGAHELGRPVEALETAASQLAAFDALPDALAERLLADSLERVDGFAAEARTLIDAWSEGSEAELTAHVFAPLEGAPELEPFYELVFTRRNLNMAGRLDGMVGDGRTRFVVVGAGHMVGERGLPALLAGRGWQVDRVGGEP